jgi:hypothetical protein
MRQVGSARHRIPPVSVFVSLALHALPLTSAGPQCGSGTLVTYAAMSSSLCATRCNRTAQLYEIK